MATVTGYTAERMQQIENETVVDGSVVDGELILIRRDLVEINAGSVVGPVGPEGPPGGISDHDELAGLTDDDHPQYHNDARGDARYLPLGADHGALADLAADDHPQYLTDARGDARYVPLASGSQVVAGTYTGDNTNARTISLPGTPKMVIVAAVGGSTLAFFLGAVNDVSTGLAFLAGAAAAGLNTTMKIVTNGFVVDNDTNAQGNVATTYRYVAFI